ncbi:MAG: hypothetical protein ABEJ31_03455 [Haloarculaceae archaeon]
MATDTTKVGLGAILLIASTVLIMATRIDAWNIPLWTGAVAALGLAAGALFVGTSGDGRPV